MADVVGLISSILQIVDFGVKVAEAVKDFSAPGRPAVIRNINSQLPFIISSLNNLKDEQYLGSLAKETRQDLQHLLEACNSQIRLLDEILYSMKSEEEDNLWKTSRKVIVFLQKQGKLREIVRELEQFKSTLTLHFIQHPHVDHPLSSNSGSLLDTRCTQNIPPLLVPNFVPRDDLLDELVATINRASFSPSQPKVVVVLGMGGQGKTQLLLKYCHVCQLTDPPTFHSILWVDASYVNSIIQSFNNLAKTIAPEHVFDTSDEVIAFVKSMFASLSKPWLIIFDNFDHPQDCQDIFNFFPPSGKGVILFSSRHVMTGNLGEVLNVSGMTKKEGLQLLFGSEVQLDEKQKSSGEKIIDMLGHLPLAIDQAHAYIQKQKLSPDEFLNHYEKRKEYILKLTPSFSRYKKQVRIDEKEKVLSVFTTWELSFDQLDPNRQKSLRDFLFLAAFFHHSHVSEDLFKVTVKPWKLISLCLCEFLTAGNYKSIPVLCFVKIDILSREMGSL
jgi:hypothetical protein